MRSLTTALVWFLVLLSFAVARAEEATVSLDLERASLPTVLRMLSVQHGLNIVAGEQIQGEVTLHLREVSLEEALTALLLANGYTFSRQGEVVVILPLDKEYPQQLESRAFELSFVTADYLMASLKDVLSPRGRMQVLSRDVRKGDPAALAPATTLVATDLPLHLARLERLIRELDRPARQVTIEVRMVETTVDGKSGLGVEWPEEIGLTLNGAGDGSLAGETAGLATASPALVFPLTGRAQYGRLSVGQLAWFLNYLQTQTDSRLISNPKVTTLDNQPARITVATTIPLQTLNRFSEGAAIQDIVSFQDKEFGIIMDVLPRVNDDSTLTLKVTPTVEDIIGYTGPVNNQRPITAKRSVETQVRLADGETMMLGGLVKDNEVKTEKRIRLLGRLPLLGRLFRHTAVERTQTDLLILITPHIVR